LLPHPCVNFGKAGEVDKEIQKLLKESAMSKQAAKTLKATQLAWEKYVAAAERADPATSRLSED
jgi:hypothetical protein